MTIVFTAASSSAIVTGCDSSVKEEYESGAVSFTTGRKAYTQRQAVVTTWGARDGNSVTEALSSVPPDANVHQVAVALDKYLRATYNPEQRGLGDVGYHIAGFVDRRPHLYHAMWQAPTRQGDPGRYSFSDILSGLTEPGLLMVYNGRDDLARVVIESFVGEIRRGQGLRFSTSNPIGLLMLTHLILRFAAEISRDVGPPFFASVISPTNAILSSRLPLWRPILRDDDGNDVDEASLQAFLRSVVALDYRVPSV